MNLTLQYTERALLLRNLLERIVPTRGREKEYSLKGVITQEERNAIIVGLQQLKEVVARQRLRGKEY